MKNIFIFIYPGVFNEQKNKCQYMEFNEEILVCLFFFCKNRVRHKLDNCYVCLNICVEGIFNDLLPPWPWENSGLGYLESC